MKWVVTVTGYNIQHSWVAPPETKQFPAHPLGLAMLVSRAVTISVRLELLPMCFLTAGGGRGQSGLALGGSGGSEACAKLWSDLDTAQIAESWAML